MAMNLRLAPETERALRAEATRSGRSQQQIVREALAVHLDMGGRPPAHNDREALVMTGRVYPPRQPYRRVTPVVTLAPGTTTADLLDRDDRL
jgi:hypothetical protein